MFTLRLAGGTSVTSSPASVTLPMVGTSKPAIMRSVVVLPQPDGPSIEKNSPSRMFRSMLFTTTFSPNALVTPLSTMCPSTISPSLPYRRIVTALSRIASNWM